MKNRIAYAAWRIEQPSVAREARSYWFQFGSIMGVDFDIS